MSLAAGATVCLRNVNAGQVVFAWPLSVMEDREDALLAGQFPGAVGMVPEGYPNDLNRLIEQGLARQWTLVPRPWQTTFALHVLMPERWWSTRLMWSAADDSFLCWYVDFCLPLVRQGANVDTRDLQLDIVVGPDRRWSWKDEDHFKLATDAGLISADQVAAVETARSEVTALIDGRSFPFDDSLLARKPTGELPVLPVDWAAL